MSREQKNLVWRSFDLIGLMLLAALACLALGIGAGLIVGGYFSPWEFAVWAVLCGAFLAVGLPGHVLSTPKNTLAHGAARTATETEAQTAARGDTKAVDLHDRKFSE